MSRRTQRIAEQLQHEIGQLLLDGVKDPRVGFVTVTGVDVSPDLGHANVYFTPHGDEKQQRRTARGLESSSRWIRGEIGRRLRLKRVPQIDFRLDHTLDRAADLEVLFDRIHREQVEQPGEESQEAENALEASETDAEDQE